VPLLFFHHNKLVVEALLVEPAVRAGLEAASLGLLDVELGRAVKRLFEALDKDGRIGEPLKLGEEAVDARDDSLIGEPGAVLVLRDVMNHGELVEALAEHQSERNEVLHPKVSFLVLLEQVVNLELRAAFGRPCRVDVNLGGGGFAPMDIREGSAGFWADLLETDHLPHRLAAH